MEQITRRQVVELLRQDNPRAKGQDLVIYADAFLSYQEAMRDIEKNGNIVAHPRTGAPIDNPYLKVRDAASRVMRGMKLIRSTELWRRAL